MTRFGTSAVLALVGSAVFVSLPAQAQLGGSATDAAPSTETIAKIAAAKKGDYELTITTRGGGAGADSSEIIPIAETVDNRVNNLPVDSAGSNSK